jgi:hypothetical protein
MFKKIFVFSLLIGILSLYSCSTVEVGAITSKTVKISSPAPDEKVVGHFHESVRFWFTIGGLINLNEPDFNEIFAEQMLKYNGDGICNLNLKDQYGGTDILISIGVQFGGYLVGMSSGKDDNDKALNGTMFSTLAGLLISSRTLYLEGDVIKK